MDSPRFLSPDDNQQPITLAEPKAKPVQPYGLAALMAGMCVLLLMEGLLPFWMARAQLVGALMISLLCYLLLTSIQPRLPLLALAILAAELGLCYSLPNTALYWAPWHGEQALVTLIAQVIGAGVAGLILGRALAVERYPQYVIPISFLFMFVLVGLWFQFKMP